MKSHLCFYSLIGKIGTLHACLLCQISDLSYCCFGFVPSTFNWSCYNAEKHLKVIHTNNIVTYGLNFCQMSQLLRVAPSTKNMLFIERVKVRTSHCLPILGTEGA